MSNDKKPIVCYQKSAAGFIQFAKDLNKAFEEGYEICTEDTMENCPRFYNRPQVMMVKRQEKGAIPVTPDGEIIELTVLEKLETITKKDDLLAFAKEHNVEVPEEVNKPLGIKKLLKEKLSPVVPTDEAPPSE